MSATMRRDVFQAIADPTRRDIIGMIAYENLNLSNIAEKFDVSRPAISQHIKILTECGLVVIKKKGREHYCEARLSQLTQVAEWAEKYLRAWEEKFDALDNLLIEMKAAEAATKKVSATAKTKKKVVDKPLAKAIKSPGKKVNNTIKNK